MPFVDRVNKRYFEGRLSSEVVELLGPINDERPDVQSFVERMSKQMRSERIDAKDFAEGLAWRVGNLLPNILPGAWDDAVPPVTQPGRHAAIDEYFARNPWRPLADGDRLLDLGCGFPPVTTLDSARRFPGVRITGADPCFGKYLVRRANGDYAVFAEDGRLIYFQAEDSWDALYRDPDETRRNFAAQLAALRSLMPPDDGSVGSIARDGVELVRNPIAEFERDNVALEPLGIGAPELKGFAGVRCFNVLFYFDDSFRTDTLAWLADTIVDGGISVIGVDGLCSRWARYSVYRAEHGSMVLKEFAFSIENVRPLELIPVFALHDNDHDVGLMSNLVGTLRSDDGFRHDIDRRMDELQAELGFCARKLNGYLGSIPREADSAVSDTAVQTIGTVLEREGFHERAADLLRRVGYDSWVNCVGHVAIDPVALPA